jgi:predicted N-formylglutamate amidohydrolase
VPDPTSYPDIGSILGAEEASPVTVHNPQAAGPVLLVCEHASNAIPAGLHNLGLDEETRKSHVAWDPGALAVSLELGQLLDATLVHQNYSRLVYDCNRPPSAADAMPARSEIFDIPGNHSLTQAQKNARTAAIYHPFEEALQKTVAERLSEGRPPILVTIHSFTPVYHGKKRAVELGILYDTDDRLGQAILDQAKSEKDMVIEANEPYSPTDGVTHTLQLHALPHGLLNVMIEIRNDLIATDQDQKTMATILFRLISSALAQISAQDGSHSLGAQDK